MSLAELVADVSPVTARRGPDVFVGDRTGGPLAPSRRASTPHLDPHASLTPARVSKHAIRVSVSAPSNPGPPVGDSEALFAAPIEDTEAADSDEACKLTCTVDQEDAWLFEATRTLLDQLGVHGDDAQIEALLAEGQSTLLAALPARALDLDRMEHTVEAQRSWLRELSRWRAKAEELCEEHEAAPA